MPIKLAEDFPAKQVLLAEDIFAIDNERAIHQDIRPLRLLILNLMPDKITTETQLLRLISQSPLQIDVDFLQISSHQHKNTSITHLQKFYLTFADVVMNCYDGMIITGAPVEQLAFTEVDYWEELTEIMDWSQTNVTSVVHICWGAQAGLFHHYGIAKEAYAEKLFGVFPQKIVAKHRLCRGFDDCFWGPQSRYTGIAEDQIDGSKLQVIARDEVIGPNILISRDAHDIFILGHFEYDTDTLEKEYHRDLQRGLNTPRPQHYYEQDNPNNPIINRWRGHAHLLYHNWLNDVYQMTPYQLAEIPSRQRVRRKATTTEE